ncbi:hypothetical protein SAICODRAFT_83385 [Saitoella complicata NRRL Y-17804]|uniref:RecQ-mediated genome instability protein 1 n=1 Tax=Saitoella complicata (strain BCRC 22490 / CBS 7301 / JCM 7358 / NBRC 10748 / NRRL Y-17804) TaxID=698492 RepID=A0A0E9NED7_SAICN|nr:uncharacterized protein SAICODRAFT_83385 [Saitoella complicata NRRL Y-17804]ODQ51430.1 hypothetical protein SAICODRAFT_83385 [Saitoella complicata NRRL Y-17804]GAO48209.1 hypothetical protein G7K_2389-t1 [Saitoella complicata NRRL Y-17804]
MTTHILDHFSSIGLPLKQNWLVSILQVNDPPQAPQLLQAYVHSHILSSSVTESIDSPAWFPPNTSEQHETTLPGPFVVQVAHVREIGESTISQLEKLESYASGETTRGRSIIRNIIEDDGVHGGATQTQGTNATQATDVVGRPVGKHTCKVTFEDGAGRRVYGIEAKAVDSFYVGMNLGCKVILRNIHMLRGVILLKPANVTMLGGKIDSWNDNLLKNLQDELERELKRS